MLHNQPDLHLTSSLLFFLNTTATTEIYTLSLHDALPICLSKLSFVSGAMSSSGKSMCASTCASMCIRSSRSRSEEHTSELQSHVNLVCRLLLEKKKKYTYVDFSVKDRWTGRMKDVS